MTPEKAKAQTNYNYIGQIPTSEMWIMTKAAKEIRASFETIGVRTDFLHPKLPDTKITVSEGNEGIILITAPDTDPSKIWAEFHKIKDFVNDKTS